MRDVDAGAPAREPRSVCALGWPAGLSLDAAWAILKNLGSLFDDTIFLILIAALIAAYRAALIIFVVWALSHEDWNAWIHALTGNTPDPAAPKRAKTAGAPNAGPKEKAKIAVWRYDDPHRSHNGGKWTTGKVVDEWDGILGDPNDVPVTSYRPDRSKKEIYYFDPRVEKWQNFTPTSWAPPCPYGGCSCAKMVLAGVGGRGTPTEESDWLSPRYMYFCPSCERHAECKNPALLERADPASPEHTEAVSAVECASPKKRGGAAVAAPGAVPRPPGPPGAPRYRDGAQQHACVNDLAVAFQNLQGCGAPGAMRMYLRDVGLRLSDVCACVEVGLRAPQLLVLQQQLEAQGHRVWGATRTTRDSQKGTGAVIVAKATVRPKPGDGLVYAAPSGKALLVALTLLDQPIYLLAAHFPANGSSDELRTFCEDLAEDLRGAVAQHQATTEGRPWAHAVSLMGADLNFVRDSTLDEEQPHPAPGAEAIAAFEGLLDTLGCHEDAFRRIHPQRRTFTHGREEDKNRRRLDAIYGPASYLQGAGGIVAADRVSRVDAGFSYINLGTRRDRHKISDHDMVRLTIRTTGIAKPPPEPRIRLATLRKREVREAVAKMITVANAATLSAEADGAERGCEVALKTLHASVLRQCEEWQYAAAKRGGKARACLLSRIRAIRTKLAELAVKPGAGDQYLRTSRNLATQTAKLQRRDHDARRAKDAQETHDAQMVEAGMGKAARGGARPEPVTRLDAPRKAGGPAEQLTTAKDIVDGATIAWKDLLCKPHTQSKEAASDEHEVLGRIQRETAGAMSATLKKGLEPEAIIAELNIEAAIRSLARHSTPGVDRIPLDFYLNNLGEMVPILHRLFKELLRRGELSHEMQQAILSPIYKEKGERHDPKMYRPISVTTIEYRILGKCIAQRLNPAVADLIGDPQVGFSPGRLYDENISTVRNLVHDLNNRRTTDGGLVFFLDNEKAFDRIQHEFMFRVLRAFNLPEGLVAAVRTMYNGAHTTVKVNGILGTPFANTSGVRQGCPLSPLLYIFVHEVQLRMIRDCPGIEGIQLPDHDGRPPGATAAAPQGQHAAQRRTQYTLRERGLVDDTMVALRSPASIKPLLEVLDRFESMGNSKMNLTKTLLLLVGGQRDFDIKGSSRPAKLLRARGLHATHDVSEGSAASLPEKWHGILLGDEAGTASSWTKAITEAVRRASRLQASALPTGSRGRLAQATGSVLGKALATLKFTVPHNQATIDEQLHRLQQAADELVLGKRRWLKAEEARQPRVDFGIGHLDVHAALQAAWLRPLLATLGTDHAQRPYKVYYAEAARLAYPEMDMGRELLSLNLSFMGIEKLDPRFVTGEVRQAFKALGSLPPLVYVEPDPDDAENGAQPRDYMSYDELMRQPLFLNPILETRARPKRATSDEEKEMLRWARAGIRRVRDILTPDGRRVMTPEELRAAHPSLATADYCHGNVAERVRRITSKLRQWEGTISGGPCTCVREGEFRLGQGGAILRVDRNGRRADATVPATVYKQQPATGRLTATGDKGEVPSRRVDTVLCHVAALTAYDSDSDGDEATDTATPTALAEAVLWEQRRQLRAPPGEPPAADTRVLAMRGPTTASAAPLTHLQTARRPVRTRDVRTIITTRGWKIPRVFELGGRFECMLCGLSAEQRTARIAAIAHGMRHRAMPEAEAYHLIVTMHHGHAQGPNKCKGDKAFCPWGLLAGQQLEDGVLREHHECEAARAVWDKVSAYWLETTGNTIDPRDPLTTVAGLRTRPALTTEALARWRNLEPAWRLLHSVTLLQLHRARCRVHAAVHAATPYPPKSATVADILREIRRRVTERVLFEHARAKHAAEYERCAGAMAAFQRHWISTGVATLGRHGPRLNP